MTGQQPERPYLRVIEIAKLLKLDRRTVLGMIDRGELPAVLVSESAGYRIRREDFEAWLARHKTGGQA